MAGISTKPERRSPDTRTAHLLSGFRPEQPGQPSHPSSRLLHVERQFLHFNDIWTAVWPTIWGCIGKKTRDEVGMVCATHKTMMAMRMTMAMALVKTLTSSKPYYNESINTLPWGAAEKTFGVKWIILNRLCFGEMTKRKVLFGTLKRNLLCTFIFKWGLFHELFRQKSLHSINFRKTKRILMATFSGSFHVFESFRGVQNLHMF